MGSVVVVRFVLTRKVWRRPRQPSARTESPLDRDTNNWIVATFAGFLLLAVLIQPWPAREAVSLRGGETVVANVVGTQGGMTLLLNHEPYGARWVPTEEVVARELCRDPDEWFQLTLGSLRPKGGIACAEILDSRRRTEQPGAANWPSPQLQAPQQIARGFTYAGAPGGG